MNSNYLKKSFVFSLISLGLLLIPFIFQFIIVNSLFFLVPISLIFSILSIRFSYVAKRKGLNDIFNKLGRILSFIILFLGISFFVKIMFFNMIY